MKIGYLDCFSGISGDMLLGAVVDAGASLEAIQGALAGLPFSGYELQSARVKRNGLAATKIDVRITEKDAGHRTLPDVLDILRRGSLDDDIRDSAESVFRALAEAEAAVHDQSPEDIHFHEVGAIDAICDVVGGVAGIHELGIEKLYCSEVALGGGTVDVEHGTLPVPAPATEKLLRDIPVHGGPVNRELTTPTGAALLSVLATSADCWPRMRGEKLGCGAGNAELEGHPNVLRLAVGRSAPDSKELDEQVMVLKATIDDMTGEELAHAAERLRDEGALDAWFSPVYMKKGRPGSCLTVLCSPADTRRMQDLLWEHTTTLGCRCSRLHRRALDRDTETVDTRWGTVRVKVARLPDGPPRCKPEYDDCSRIARREGLSLRQVRREARRAWQSSPGQQE